MATDHGNAPAVRRKRIAFVINSLAGGGAERVMTTLLVGLEARLSEYDIHLILLDREPARHTVPGYVRTHQLDCRFRLFRTLLFLSRALRRLSPDVVVSFLERSNVANVVCGAALRHRSLVCEHTNTSTHLGSGPAGWLKKLVVRLTYPRANRVIAVSNGTRDDLIENFGVSADKVDVINNPVDRERILSQSRSEATIAAPAEYAVAVGRLVPIKNFSLLIEALARTPDLNLVILGEGPERKGLEDKVRSNGLTNRVVLPGYVENPFPIIAKASFFVSSSKYEAFPMALVEAMCLGLPVIATDCPTGPAEILSGKNRPEQGDDFAREFGILVPTDHPEAMSQALRLMSDPDVRAAYSRKSLERSLSFSASAARERYAETIRALLDGPRLGRDRQSR
ncbi:MAG: glycosyltransferase [Propylenella sp.]